MSKKPLPEFKSLKDYAKHMNQSNEAFENKIVEANEGMGKKAKAKADPPPADPPPADPPADPPK